MAISLSDILHNRPVVEPQIYGYIIPGMKDHEGYIKIGYTDKEDVEDRIAEQLGTSTIHHKTVFKGSAVRNDGTCFRDSDIHNLLLRKGFKKLVFNDSTNNEWFKCSVDDLKTAYLEVKTYARYEGNRNESFQMREEQARAVQETIDYFNRMKVEEPDTVPKFLWNAKMRFGKTFATYELAKTLNMKRVLIMTFKPAVEAAWEYDLTHHVDFAGWQFVSNKEAKYDAAKIDEQYKKCDKTKPIVVFGSFQDLLGTNDKGGIKAKNEFIHTDNWDMVVFDEYHFGAWRDNAKKLFELPDEEEDFDIEEYQENEAANAINESWLPITTDHYLYLSGTPFRALNSGEFLEEQIFNWTYSDEQSAKEKWDYSKGKNPYAHLPKMVMMTYKIPESITEVAVKEGYDEFDLNEFFKAETKEKNDPVESARFVYEDYVQKWVDLIQGKGNFIDGLKLGNDRPPMPYSDTTLLSVLTHTFWYMPSIKSCWAMYNLLTAPHNKFFNDYKIIVCAGIKAGIGIEALKPVEAAMGDPLKTKTITLSCGKLATGVTVRPWSGIFMLRNLSSPETYFQAAFRVQNPWVITDEEGNEVDMKRECYIFDFALERALKQISDYSVRLNTNDSEAPEKKVSRFINFLPVLAFDGAGMNQISAQDVLDITYSGTSATLLAKRWQTALLVHVDNDTLKRLQSNPDILAALSRLEGFRRLNDNIETIINRSEKIKKTKTTDSGSLDDSQKKQLTKEEKELKSLRKQVQENLLKLAARIPAFMYLTDYREQCLKDVITQIEPGLFMKVTGLTVNEFDAMCSIGLFDPEIMNQGIFGFRRYENSSLSYTGIDKHAGEDVGGWDTVLRREEYDELYSKQQTAMVDFTELILSNPVKTEEKITVAVKTPTKEKENKSGLSEEEISKWEKELSAIKVGSTVYHKGFGKGRVMSFKNNMKSITVRFTEGEKVFPFPAVFINGFLKTTSFE